MTRPNSDSSLAIIGIALMNSAETRGMPMWPRDCMRSFHSGRAPLVPMSESTGVAGESSRSTPRSRIRERTKPWFAPGSSPNGTVENTRTSASDSSKAEKTLSASTWAAEARERRFSMRARTPLTCSRIWSDAPLESFNAGDGSRRRALGFQ